MLIERRDKSLWMLARTRYGIGSTVSDNGGRTWSAPRKLYDPHTSDSWPATSTILVNRDGSLLDVFALATQAGAGPAQEISTVLAQCFARGRFIAIGETTS